MGAYATGRADRRVLVAAAVLFMELADATVILTALPSIGQSFGVSANSMSIGVTAYAVAVAAFIPASGWAADRIGARRLLGCALALFVASSLLCALAQTLEVFIAARILQGVAGAMMAPVARLLALADVEPSKVMRTIAVLTWPALLAPLAAPVIGGAITEYVGWRWIFVLNVPIGMLAIIAVLIVFGPQDWPAQRRKLDAPGLVYAAAAGGGVVWALDLAVRGQSLWGAALGAALIAFCFLAWRVTRTPAPILNPGLFSVATFAVSSAQSGLLMRLAINATPYLVLLVFQLVHGMGPTEAGSMLMIYMGGNIAMKPATTWVLRQWTFREVLAWNGALAAAASTALAFVGKDTSIWVVSFVLFVAGLSRSLNFTATNTLAFADIGPAARNDASTLVSVLQQAALSLGVGVAACLLAVSAIGAPTPEGGDFRFAFLIVSLLMAISAFGYLVSLPRNAGDNLRP